MILYECYPFYQQSNNERVKLDVASDLPDADLQSGSDPSYFIYSTLIVQLPLQSRLIFFRFHYVGFS
jgi:hypothetical protein